MSNLPASLFRLVGALCLVICGAVLGLAPQPAAAESQGSISVPESVPDMGAYQLNKNLLDPEPLNWAWNKPGHRPLGVHLDDYNLTESQIEAAQSTGCKLVRLAIPMEKFLEDADPDWSVLDQVISRLSRADFEILPVLTAKVAVPEFYVAFCEAVATRYGSTFKYYQLLDNINYKIGLTSQGYADLISVARTAIVLADRDALIVSGGIRGADLTYIDMLNNQGAMSCIDVIALNMYPPRGGIEYCISTHMAEHSLPYVADVVTWAQSQGKQVWITSFGVSSCFTWGGGDQVEQAEMYARGALYLGWVGAERVIFSSIQDTDPTFQRPAGNCGFLDIGGVPKAAYYILRALNQVVDGAYYVTAPCLYQGGTFQQPNLGDVLVAPELIGEEDMNLIEEYAVHGLKIFAFWFYSPVSEEYIFVYWLGQPSNYRTLLSLMVGDIGLTPVERFILLDNAPSPVQYTQARDFQYIPYLPVDTIPGVIRFEVNDNGRTR